MNILYILISLLLSVELVFLADYLWNSRNRQLHPLFALGLTVFCFLLLFFGYGDHFLPLLALAVALPVAIATGLAVCRGWNRRVCRQLSYACNDRGKAALYAGKKVMVIVPHPDDDMNITAGILEQYAAYGSEVFVVFATNGDYWDIAALRLREAIRALGSIGIPEDHVIFLGYADGWADDGAHIYHAPPGELCRSRNGYTATYALPSHPAWNEGNPYTSDHYLEDLQSVIRAHHPDLIICSDYDPHIEHRALSLAFEKVMGRLLKQEPDYQPVVLKAFAYCTAWRAAKDFPAPNLLSTADPGELLPPIYRWSDRLRLPVDGSKLSRSLLNSGSYRPISLYRSQRAGIAAGAIINGDKVFWQRRTDSLLLHARIEASSGDAKKLHDFMLLDAGHLSDGEQLPLEGVWSPAADDPEKTIRITLPAPSHIDTLVLCGAPAAAGRVLNAKVVFDNGYRFETGALDGVSGTTFRVGQDGVRTFTVTLLETEGACAGLSEIEAFAQRDPAPFPFIKLMSTAGNFAYDYMIGEAGTEELLLYTCGNVPALSAEAYRVSCSGTDCMAVIHGDRLRIRCPVGSACGVTVTARGDDTISDSIWIRNPPGRERRWIARAQRMETFFHRRAAQIWKRTALFSIYSTIRKILRSGLHRCRRLLHTKP